MANRRKIQQSAGKSKPPQVVSANESSNDFEFPDAEQQARYDLELDWCVRKLQIGISNEKDQKKSTDALKFLNTLTSKSVSVIRKRQIMHNLFGDYRAKMKSDEKTHGKTKVSFKENVKLDSLVKSKFLRKSTTKSTKSLEDLPELNENMNNLALNVEHNNGDESKKNFYKMPTGNSGFTFNFKIDAKE